jgi:heptosyltransferase-2
VSARLARAPNRLLIIAPNWLGDAVMALPLIADVQRSWPDTELVVAARRSVVPLFARVRGVSRTIALAGGGGWRGLAAVRENIASLAAGAFEAALLLPNSFQAAWVASRAGIPERWGFSRDLRGRLLTRAIARPRPGAHQAEYYQALGAGLGLAIGDRFARVEVQDDDRSRARALLAAAGLTVEQRFAVFAPGAAYGRAKQWLPERYAELAALLAEHGCATVLVGTSADESVCEAIARAGTGTGTGTSTGTGTGTGTFNLAGQTDLASLAGLLSLSTAVVANDSGAMHLAAAVGAPVVAVFGPTDDRKTSPLRAHASAPEPLIITTDVWCRPCMLRECPIDHRCMTGVSARRVFDALALA